MIKTREISNNVNKKKKIFSLDNAGFVKIPVVSNNVLIYL
jgi:hypothetical protein